MYSEEVVIGGLPVMIIKKANLKNWYLRIFPPDGEVSVSVPLNTKTESVRLFVLRKMPEIIKTREKMLGQPLQNKREYISGESYYIWGKPYRLQVVYQGKRSRIEKTPTKLVLTVPEGTTEAQKEKIITEWYRKEIKRIMGGVIALCEKRTGIQAAEYRVKNMHTRWGTCKIPERRIWINLQLAKKPVECLEYVITHELVHLLEENHTHRFQALVEEFYPQWREAEKILATLPLDYMEKGAINKVNDEADTERYL